ncbi:M13 family metallopeptidase [Butyrivibrio sp. LB2008]|uniref:M13 family metallopeptidase n=1 Tax=Butyrivibrio sp. LB2008 TaxID=1408305 RepID=UPI000478847A|nr:M13 family metallopeptidase [Butyrivibrio sp. LB2008]
MKKGIQRFAAGMTLASVLAFSFYGADVRAEEVNIKAQNGTQTKESEDIRPQDDFFGYVNAKVLREADIDPKYGFGAFDDCKKITDQKLFEIIDEIKGEAVHTSTDAEMIADYYDRIVSYDAASSDADKDFENVRKEIEGVSNKQEYMELLGKYQRLYGISPVLCFGITDGQVRADEYSFFFSGVRSIFEKNNKDIAESLEGRTGVRDHVKEVLVGLGTDKKEAEKTADDFARFAVDIAYKSKDMKFEFYNAEKVDAKEMEKLKFDIKSFEKGMQIENPYGYWLINEKDQFAYIAEKLDDKNNLDEFKTWLLIEYIDSYNRFLSDKYKNLKATYSEDTENMDMQAKVRIISDLPDNIGRLYSEKCYPQSRDAKVKEMCESIKDSYRELIGKADWLTEDGRTKLLNKLEAIEFTTGGNYSEKLIDTDNLIGKDSYDTYKNIQNFKTENYKELIKRPRPKMGSTMQPQTVNACYWVDNMVVMTAAITEGAFFNENNSEFSNLGRLGMVIAHEVGHAFDSNCINWDDKGNYNPQWLNETDRQALKERAGMCIDYYNAYTIMDVYHVDGVQTLGENYADIGAIECISNIAKEKKDYIEMYEGFAEIWRGIKSDTEAIAALHTDEHSPGPVRVNAPLSSCEKFYEVYDVKEGDGMYVAPEKRVERW